MIFKTPLCRALAIRCGAKSALSRRITHEDVQKFGSLIGDTNPIHSSKEAALQSGFPDIVCHGMFLASLISGLMATKIPGPQTVYVSQHLRFEAPVVVGDEVNVCVEVMGFRKAMGLIEMSTKVYKKDVSNGKEILCVDGKAVGVNKKVVFEGHRTSIMLLSSFERSWKTKMILPYERRGRFNLDEAANELQLDENYVASLYKPLHYTYNVKGQRYPGEQGRTSRPGSLSSSRDRMFPLYRRNYKLDRELRQDQVERIHFDRE